jgi:hypothetical protein
VLSEAVVILEPILTISASFVTGAIVGGVIGGILGAHLMRPREETETSYEQRGFIFKDLVKVETRTIKCRGVTLSKNIEEHKVAQKVDMETVRGLRREAETLAHHVLRFLPNPVRMLLGG